MGFHEVKMTPEEVAAHIADLTGLTADEIAALRCENGMINSLSLTLSGRRTEGRLGCLRGILASHPSKLDGRNVCRLRLRVGGLAFLFATVVLAALGETVALTEDFESPNAFSQWHSDGGFSVEEGTGVAGSRGLVWEQSCFRPMKVVTPPVVEGNIVRPVSRAVPERFSKGVVLEPGRIYSFSVKINGAVTNNCAYVFLAWYDRDGKRIGRADGRPTIYKDAGRKGWETVSAATPRLPSDVVRGEIMVELYRTTLGRMAFGNFSGDTMYGTTNRTRSASAVSR